MDLASAALHPKPKCPIVARSDPGGKKPKGPVTWYFQFRQKTQSLEAGSNKTVGRSTGGGSWLMKTKQRSKRDDKNTNLALGARSSRG